jgi:hypothetical protein
MPIRALLVATEPMQPLNQACGPQKLNRVYPA